MLYEALGYPDAAEDYALRALDTSRRLDFPVGEIDMLCYLGRIRTRSGRP